MPFKKGDPNINRKGRPRDGESWTEILKNIGETRGETGKALKEEVLEMLYKKAAKGDLRAAELILDRIEGKAVAKIEQKVEDVTPSAKVSFKGNIEELPKPEQTKKLG